MKTIQLTLIALTIAVGTLSSCKKKKEELPVPPESKTKSFSFTTTNSAWTQSGKEYKAVFTLEDISSEVLSTGSVTVYRGDGTGSVWAAMPVDVENVQYRYTINLHTVNILVSANDNAAINSPGVQQFRVVVTKQ